MPTPRTDPAKYSQGHWKCNKAHAAFGRGYFGGEKNTCKCKFHCKFQGAKKGAVKSPFPVNGVCGASGEHASHSGCGVYAECLPLSD